MSTLTTNRQVCMCVYAMSGLMVDWLRFSFDNKQASVCVGGGGGGWGGGGVD